MNICSMRISVLMANRITDHGFIFQAVLNTKMARVSKSSSSSNGREKGVHSETRPGLVWVIGWKHFPAQVWLRPH